MAMNPLPPQAYTKDTLLRAYAWLQNQNPSIRGMATTPDILVSLYLKTTRDGEEALDRPSIQNFKNELKSLAGLMGELEIGKQVAVETPVPLAVQTPVQSTDETPQTWATNQKKPLPKNQMSSDALTVQSLDPLSLEMLEEVKNGFNLSDQAEALRMLIKLGYLKAKKILTE